MKTNSNKKPGLILQNLIKCLNTNTPFSQVGKVISSNKPKTKTKISTNNNNKATKTISQRSLITKKRS